MGSKKESNSVFIISIILIGAIVVWGLAFPASFEAVANATFGFLVQKFGWFYALMMTSFVVFVIWIGFFSKYKNMRLGPDDSRPEYSTISWFAMLFSAGMGIGLVFWGVAEPLNFFVAPLGADPGTKEAAQFAMGKAFLHWGLHPWANYAVFALALAYMQFRKGKPALVSSIFIPLIGEERVNGWIGKLIDVLAIFATISGVATSFGLGAYQINSGLNFLFDIPESNLVVIIIVVIISVLVIWTAVSGLDKGIKILADLNVRIAGVLLIALLILGPTVLILSTLIESIGIYIQNLPLNSLQIGAFGESEWFGGWTIFYWAWWIAWAPFTGSFIARISRGRTVREFIAGVLLAPSIASFIWFAVFGRAGMEVGLDKATDAIQSTSTALFVVLQEYPLGSIISLIAIVLLGTFFITSANSATFVLGMMSQRGDLNPSNLKKFVWGVLQSLLALALMLGSVNGLQMLQNISIVAAFPFAFIMGAAMISIIKVLKKDTAEEAKKEYVK